MTHSPKKVEVWEETVVLPTYEVGKPDKNPMFLEKRVYQGSSGKVYPLPVIDKIYDEKVDKSYRAVFLENDYLRVMILPELGGRIHRAYDKTIGYDFVYYNEVVKPALVGLAGPWISGGIEFNWPQHHRPTTFSPVDYVLRENDDGSKSVLMSEVDQMYGTKGMAVFTLYPDRAYIEIKGQLYNRTNLPQTFLWWANPAVAVNDNTQSIFPPDVNAVMDHGKRDVSKFPIATGVYYKHDYGEGVDISRYKNIPVPTSYMAYHSDYDFVGGYDYGVEAGILHVADHHVSPGKKQWTWGCGDFGKAWDRNLTDENGPYIELMTGMFTDNQPDFTWLLPFEEKTFTQYFLPYQKVGRVKNASADLLLGLETEGGTAQVRVYATRTFTDARIVLEDGGVYLEKRVTLSPAAPFAEDVKLAKAPDRLTLSVCDSAGQELLRYRQEAPRLEKVPEAAKPAEAPEKIATCEELYLTGQHIEQYRHATYEPDGYYLEGLKRDPGDIRLNNAYGLLRLRRGEFSESEPYFRRATARLTSKNPNPYDGEAFLNLGLSLFYQGKDAEAFDAFYKATWSGAQQEAAFYYLGAIRSREKDYEQALAFARRSLVKNAHNLKTRGLLAAMLRKLGRDAQSFLRETLALDPFHYLTRMELALGGEAGDPFAAAGDRASTFIECAIDYAEMGLYEEAVRALRLCKAQSPMLRYYEAAYLSKQGQPCQEALKDAAGRSPLYCFPNRLEDIAVLRHAMQENPGDSKAPYYLGCLLYDKKRYGEAQALWEASVSLDVTFPTVHRNLSLYYYNKQAQPQKARQEMECAFRLDPTDARILLELDQLYKKLGMAPAKRLQNLEAYRETVAARDDLFTEYITLLNLAGRYDEALERMMGRKFHPWEGGEGKITRQYVVCLTQLARAALANGDAAAAKQRLTAALRFPENLGEGKLEGAKDNDVYYLLGKAEQALGNEEAAAEHFRRACVGDVEPAGMMYYNDQPADMILYQGLALRALGDGKAALKRFHKLADYGERHLFDQVSIDYFAVSLPDLQLFADDLTARNQAHCHYLIALGSYGLGDLERMREALGKTLEIDGAHPGAALHARILDTEGEI